MAKPAFITLYDGTELPILYEDRSVMAIDKPAGWMLAPNEWKNTSRNLQRELMLSLEAGEYWAVSRRLRYIRYIHRLDAETSGILLLAKSAGALSVMSELFESRRMSKRYLAGVRGVLSQPRWTCRLRLSDELDHSGRIRVDERNGKDAETEFRLLQQRPGRALVEAIPLTGRTHQLRVHLEASGHPVLGDELYAGEKPPLALRAIELSYVDPFQRRPVRICVSADEFLRQFGFPQPRSETRPKAAEQ